LNNAPVISRKRLFSATKGTPPSNVPAGQIYLQKAGEATPFCINVYTGNSITNTSSIPYFSKDKRRVRLPFLILGDGILYKSSCINPNGQRNAHMARPNNMPKTNIIPTM